MKDIAKLNPKQIRSLIRMGERDKPAPGHMFISDLLNEELAAL